MEVEYNLSIILASPDSVAEKAEILADIIKQLTEQPPEGEEIETVEKTSTTSTDVISIATPTKTTADKKRDAATV
jgi:hypothetical protein